MRIALLGDVSFNGDLATREPGSWELIPDRCVALIRRADWTLLNLESPLEGKGEENELKEPRLKTREPALDNLEVLGKSVASLANNHAYDCLVEGYLRTTSALSRRGVLSSGAGLTQESASQPLVIDGDSATMGILAYVDPSTNPRIPDDAGFHLNCLDEDALLNDVSSLRTQVDHCVVYLHWGKDYFDYPLPGQVYLARQAIDAGATIVAGCHAHVIQGWERYRDGYIFYGLGNTCFGASDRLAYRKKNRRSLIAVLELEKNGACSLTDLIGMERSPDGLRAELIPENELASCTRQLCEPIACSHEDYERRFKLLYLRHSLFARPYAYLFNDQRTFWEQLQRFRPTHLISFLSALTSYRVS
jgi:poly-gamma-glutamate synthesis protein (capsule biosynthesis protein)